MRWGIATSANAAINEYANGRRRQFGNDLGKVLKGQETIRIKRTGPSGLAATTDEPS